MRPLGLVDVPNKVKDLELPLANGANINGVSFGTPPTNSCNDNDQKTHPAQHTAPHLNEFIPHASHGPPRPKSCTIRASNQQRIPISRTQLAAAPAPGQRWHSIELMPAIPSTRARSRPCVRYHLNFNARRVRERPRMTNELMHMSYLSQTRKVTTTAIRAGLPSRQRQWAAAAPAHATAGTMPLTPSLEKQPKETARERSSEYKRCRAENPT